jgi:ubiquinone biosynthesis protein
MPDLLLSAGALQGFSTEQLKSAFFETYQSREERLRAIEEALRSPAGQLIRERIGQWVIARLPAEELVPAKYSHWRPLVQDAMLFMFMHLSIGRLAPKLVEQLELPSNTPTGTRLLKLIAKVPGLQKLGQVLARNRHLQRQLRRALTKLENGISDMDAKEVEAIINHDLSAELKKYDVHLQPGIFSEASVSAVMRFRWRNPATGRRERGVFKVIKPYIPTCFAEDMELLAQLAKHVGSKHQQYGFAKRVLPDTFNDVRRLLRHEVDFPREQATLAEASRIYKSMSAIRVPSLIRPLCTSKITAMTEANGEKITKAVVRMPLWQKAWVAGSLIEAFLAVPLFSTEEKAMFHADPHAGNLLYDRKSGELSILDWALTERVSREERRHLAIFFLFTALRDPQGIFNQIQALSRGGMRRKRLQAKIVRDCINQFIEQLPVTRIPGTKDALDLLESIAFKGVRLPAPLIMLRKVLLTLDGVLYDMGDPDVSMMAVIARHATVQWLTSWKSIGSPLLVKDWLSVQFSSLFYGSRVFWQGTHGLLDRSLSMLSA